MWATEGTEKAATLTIPTPATAITKGTILSATDLSLTTVPAGKVFISTVQRPEQALGMQALRNLPAGMPISLLHLKAVPAISRGALVPFAYTRGAVRLSGQAQALEDAQVGQSIRLLNLATRATVVGTVQPGGQVIVN